MSKEAPPIASAIPDLPIRQGATWLAETRKGLALEIIEKRGGLHICYATGSSEPLKSWADVQCLYDYYLRDPIVYVLGDDNVEWRPSMKAHPGTEEKPYWSWECDCGYKENRNTDHHCRLCKKEIDCKTEWFNSDCSSAELSEYYSLLVHRTTIYVVVAHLVNRCIWFSVEASESVDGRWKVTVYKKHKSHLDRIVLVSSQG